MIELNRTINSFKVHNYMYMVGQNFDRIDIPCQSPVVMSISEGKSWSATNPIPHINDVKKFVTTAVSFDLQKLKTMKDKADCWEYYKMSS